VPCSNSALDDSARLLPHPFFSLYGGYGHHIKGGKGEEEVVPCNAGRQGRAAAKAAAETAARQSCCS